MIVVDEHDTEVAIARLSGAVLGLDGYHQHLPWAYAHMGQLQYSQRRHSAAAGSAERAIKLTSMDFGLYNMAALSLRNDALADHPHLWGLLSRASHVEPDHVDT